MFDLCHPAFMNDSVSCYRYIPGSSAVPKDASDAYFLSLGAAALRAAACGGYVLGWTEGETACAERQTTQRRHHRLSKR